MLTGDKEETAINIAVACQLLAPETLMERIVVNMDPQVSSPGTLTAHPTHPMHTCFSRVMKQHSVASSSPRTFC